MNWALSVFIFLSGVVGCRANADTSYFNSQPLLFVSTDGEFTAPNEKYPQRLMPFWQNAPVGAYVSVGTERGFIGAANSPNATDLILIDTDSAAVAYNQINALLLRTANDRKDYLRLRLRPNLDEWTKSAARAELKPSETHYLLEQLQSWKKQVATHRKFKNFHREQRGFLAQFGAANYLYNDAAFAKIQSLAKADKIKVVRLELSHPDEVLRLTQTMEKEHINLSVLDLSNAWWHMYVDRKALVRDLEIFDFLTNQQSLLITSGYRWAGAIDLILDHTAAPFQYSVYSFEYIRKFKSMNRFIHSLHWSRFKLRRHPSFYHRHDQFWQSCRDLLS